MTITVTDVAAADMAALAKLREGLAAHFGDAVELTAAETAACVSPPHHAALIARVDGDPAGFLSYSVFPSICRPGDWGQIAELFVCEGLRGRGIGNALLEAALERFAARGLTEVSVSTFPDNGGALRLYRSFGFARELVTLEKDITRAPAGAGAPSDQPEEER
jgi:ribosomal protein S18 acetylase RimI-like enzyme